MQPDRRNHRARGAGCSSSRRPEGFPSNRESPAEGRADHPEEGEEDLQGSSRFPGPTRRCWGRTDSPRLHRECATTPHEPRERPGAGRKTHPQPGGKRVPDTALRPRVGSAKETGTCSAHGRPRGHRVAAGTRAATGPRRTACRGCTCCLSQKDPHRVLPEDEPPAWGPVSSPRGGDSGGDAEEGAMQGAGRGGRRGSRHSRVTRPGRVWRSLHQHPGRRNGHPALAAKAIAVQRNQTTARSCFRLVAAFTSPRRRQVLAGSHPPLSLGFISPPGAQPLPFSRYSRSQPAGSTLRGTGERALIRRRPRLGFSL